MEIILNQNGNITVNVGEYNQEETAFIIEDTLRRHGISSVTLFEGKQESNCWNCKHLHKSMCSKSNGDELIYNCWCTIKELGTKECDQFVKEI